MDTPDRMNPAGPKQRKIVRVLHRALALTIAAPVIVIALLGLCSCDDVINEHLTGPFILVAVDVDEQLSVSRDLGNGGSIGRIGPVVTDVGWNAKYIVAM